jgi:D-sedoheptulose 7-phosphate isomerase
MKSVNDIRCEFVRHSLSESIAVKQCILENTDLIDRIQAVATACQSALRAGNRILLAGNGGSAADAQHIAAEFVSRFMYDRPGLSAMALTTDTSMLTAIGNDYGYERLFERQLQANARQGDVFFGITTSGNSENVLRAISLCSELGVTSVGLTGNSGKIQSMCNYVISVPSSSTPRIQEAHIAIGHIVCGLVETALFPRGV